MTFNRTKKPHISYSQMGMWSRCGVQYFYRYRKGLKVPPASALTQGISCDVAINVNYEQKIKSWEDLPQDDVKDAYVTEFDKRKQDTDWQKDEKPEDMRAHGIKIVETFRADVAPNIQPVSVQEKLWVPFEGFPVDLVGVIDVTALADKEKPDGPIIIRDNKTTAKSPPSTGGFANEADRLQLALYSLGNRAKTGKIEAGVAVDYLVKLKEPKAVTVEDVITESDHRFALQLIGRVVDAIEKSVFVPNRTGFMCNKRHCGYHMRCVKDFGGRIRE